MTLEEAIEAAKLTEDEQVVALGYRSFHDYERELYGGLVDAATAKAASLLLWWIEEWMRASHPPRPDSGLDIMGRYGFAFAIEQVVDELRYEIESLGIEKPIAPTA